MFLNPDIVLTAFSSLSAVAPEDVEDTGKVARERVSGLRYFFAAAEMLSAGGKSSIVLSPQERQARKQFILAVGNVVRLDGAYGYTNNFKAELKRASDYQVGSNFLTTVLKIDKGYPGRPASLLQVKSNSLSLHTAWRDHLREFGTFNIYRIPLVIWLARFETFEETAGTSTNELAKKIGDFFQKRYGDIADAFFTDHAEIAAYFNSYPSSTLLVEEQPDYYSLLDSKPLVDTTQAIGQNVIIYGAPGTGKSYKLKQYEPAVRTVFHRDYQNTDFVGSYRPYIETGKITYAFAPGPFIRAIINAMNYPEQHHYLIIEEINRADAGSVFGEAFQLLDRDIFGSSEYEIDIEPALKDYVSQNLTAPEKWNARLYIPSNLSIFATMNSADQGVQPMDSAFKRRWRFEYLPIQFDKVAASDIRREKKIPYAGSVYSWCEFAESINRALVVSGIDEDRLLGPFFLANSDLNAENIYAAISNKVFIYLWDDVLRHGYRSIVFNCEKYSSFNDVNFAYRDDESVFTDEINALLQRILTSED